MTSIFTTPDYDRDEAEAHNLLQDEFGKRGKWTHIPMVKKPNFSPIPDTNRPMYELRAVFSWEAQDVGLRMEQAGVSSRDPRLYLHTCDVRGPVRTGDLFRDREGTTFEVTDVKRDGQSGIKLDLVQMGRQR